MNCKFVLSLAAVLLVLSSDTWAADDGAALYKTKCAACHGAQGEGKPAMKAPALKGIKMEVSEIGEHLTKGESGSRALHHDKGIAGLNDGRAKAIAEYVKSLN